jgi:hypothetical protein
MDQVYYRDDLNVGTFDESPLPSIKDLNALLSATNHTRNGGVWNSQGLLFLPKLKFSSTDAVDCIYMTELTNNLFSGSLLGFAPLQILFFM